MSATATHPARHGRVRGFGHFVLHFFEMCMPMCIGPMLLPLDLYTGRAMGAHR